ncbi:MAG: UxaA family hydrolase [Chloroflexota bacterium]
MQFLGFPRADGSVGARNYILVIPGGLIAAKICDFVPGTRTIVTSNAGGGLTSRDRETVARTLIGLGKNPNVAGVIVHNGTTTAGYSELRPLRLASEIAKSGKPVELIDVAKEGGTLEAIARGIRVARQFVFEASRVRREPFGLDRLVVGVKCGSSDPTSGMAGNPAIGYLFDRIVDAGGTAMFGETTEIIGAEHVLVQRAADSKTADSLLSAVRFVEERSIATGEDIRTINPVPVNIAAGISSLEEKSLGAIHKSGHHQLQGVLKYAEQPTGRGLFFVDNWMGNLSIFTGYAASGAQLSLFQLGGGGRTGGKGILESPPAVVAPVLWASANPITYERSGDSLDFYSGTVIEGRETPEEVGQRLVQVVADIASGTLSRGETVNHSDPTQIYTLDPVF